jgi:hypothetical protein
MQAMTSLYTIVRATRRSANAITAMSTLSRAYRDADAPAAKATLDKRLRAAKRRYEAAQRTLANNPLPGDR